MFQFRVLIHIEVCLLMKRSLVDFMNHSLIFVEKIDYISSKTNKLKNYGGLSRDAALGYLDFSFVVPSMDL
jgi:hypothetical protein